MTGSLNGSHGKEVTLFSHSELLASGLELAVGPWVVSFWVSRVVVMITALFLSRLCTRQAHNAPLRKAASAYRGFCEGPMFAR